MTNCGPFYHKQVIKAPSLKSLPASRHAACNGRMSVSTSATRATGTKYPQHANDRGCVREATQWAVIAATSCSLPRSVSQRRSRGSTSSSSIRRRVPESSMRSTRAKRKEEELHMPRSFAAMRRRFCALQRNSWLVGVIGCSPRLSASPHNTARLRNACVCSPAMNTSECSPTSLTASIEG